MRRKSDEIKVQMLPVILFRTGYIVGSEYIKQVEDNIQGHISMHVDKKRLCAKCLKKVHFNVFKI